MTVRFKTQELAKVGDHPLQNQIWQLGYDKPYLFVLQSEQATDSPYLMLWIWHGLEPSIHDNSRWAGFAVCNRSNNVAWLISSLDGVEAVGSYPC